MSYILHQPIWLPNRRKDAGNMNIIKALLCIQRTNWRCLSGLEGSIRLKAINARKGSSLPLRLISLIRILPSKQNGMRLVSPDPRKREFKLH